MLQRTVTGALLMFATVLISARPAHAQQTVNFTLGYFAPLGEDSRVSGDVLNVNRTFLVFDIDDFGSASVGGEWLIPLGNFFEAGAGISWSGQTVPTVYRAYVDPNGTEVDSDLKLRLMPVAFTVRVLPFGQSSPVQPYFGAGLGLVNWRYTEEGEFIDFGSGLEIFEDSFEASGTATGAVVLGGIRFGGRSVSAGGEVRYQKADDDLPNDFAGSRIDLGGWTYNFTLGVRF